MNGKEKSAQEFGRALAADGGPPSLDERLLSQRQAVIETVLAVPERQRRRRRRQNVVRFSVAVSAAAAALLLYIHFVPKSSDRIPFFIGDSQVQEMEGRFVSCGPKESTVVRFDGGSRFEFVKSTEARVVKSSGRTVTVDLEQGRVKADVNPQSNREWTVRAGPYQVVVKGTIFSVDWNDQGSVLSVHVDRGRVAVLGPGLDKTGVPLAAGTSLKADARAGRITFQRVSEEEEPEQTVSPLLDTEEVTPEPAPELKIIRHKAVSKTKAQFDNYHRLYRSKDYVKLLSIADANGILQNPQSLRQEDLWMFANACRYARRTSSANKLFEVYRKQFPHSNRAQTAAFLLARSAFAKRDMRGAKRWFGTYLAESPSGPLAEEAHGHLMDVHSDLGNFLQAKRLARDYLAKYKGGYFSKQAKKILSE